MGQYNPGYQNDPLTTKEKRRIYLATFPKNWMENFDGAKDIDNTSYEEINHFMEKQKEKADKEHSKRENEKKEEEEEKKKAHSGVNWQSKFKIDPKKNHGPQARCKKCPNAKHSWAQCFHNPANPNNKLGDPNFMQKVQGNGNFQNNQQPRQAFYRHGG